MNEVFDEINKKSVVIKDEFEAVIRRVVNMCPPTLITVLRCVALH